MPTNLTCEDFGLSQEQMIDRLIETMADRLLGEDEDYEPEEESYGLRKTVMDKLDAKIKERIDEQVTKIAEKHVFGAVGQMLENLVFPQTNKFGEAKKEPLTLREYLAKRAEGYMAEEVDRNGKTKSQDSYSWRPDSSRLMYAVNENLQYVMNIEVEKAAKSVHGAFAKSVQDAVTRAIRDLRVSVSASVKS